MGHFRGTRYTTGVVKVLVRTECKGLEINSEEHYDMRQSSTFVDLTAAVSDAVTKEVDVRHWERRSLDVATVPAEEWSVVGSWKNENGRLKEGGYGEYGIHPQETQFWPEKKAWGEGGTPPVRAFGHEDSTSSQISFSVQDNQWSQEWRALTGIPLVNMKQRWNEPRPVPPSGTGGFSQSAFVELSMVSKMPTDRAIHRLELVACGYLACQPGDTSATKNHALHSDIDSLLANNLAELEKPKELSASLDYRLRGMRLATSFKDFLRIDMPDCEDCDQVELLLKTKTCSLEEAGKILAESHLFAGPEDKEGMKYAKSSLYLRCVLASTNWSLSRIKEAVSELQKLRNMRSNTAFTARSRLLRGDRYLVS